MCKNRVCFASIFYALSLAARVAGRWSLGSLVAIHSWLAWSLIADCCRLAVHSELARSHGRDHSRSLLEESPDRYMLKAREPCTLRPRRPGGFRDLR
ncbi:UNVERIFIED_CONTAM: hypothetical protein Slati_1109900 [Sesamum latifolium]|uniref:Secreted protein n=1 Tax=Sesamum latifolium TaxID=2727402 RepID=A0AAW2XBF3_9LAMI